MKTRSCEKMETHPTHEWIDPTDGIRKECNGYVFEEEENPEHREQLEQMSRPFPEKATDPIFDAYPNHVEMGKTVQRWADNAMFSAAPLDKDEGPKVYLLSMTPDPLGTIAAVNQMYVGKPVRSLSNVTDDERREHWQRVMKTRLKAPFEFVKFHFMIEGVTRAFTHQMVRQRTATFAQESLRFAVVEDNFADRVALPPSLADTEHYSDPGMMMTTGTFGRLSQAQQQRVAWDLALEGVQDAYTTLVDSGMPAEDARGLMPTNILTRLHYTTDLRALLEHAGNRLCTQSQYEWRVVWARIIEAIREYGFQQTYKSPVVVPGWVGDRPGRKDVEMTWQTTEISRLFKPICFQTHRCEFMSPDDRACSIRDRVQSHYAKGEKSEDWEDIHPVEWLGDPSAARHNGGGHLGG